MSSIVLNSNKMFMNLNITQNLNVDSNLSVGGNILIQGNLDLTKIIPVFQPQTPRKKTFYKKSNRKHYSKK